MSTSDTERTACRCETCGEVFRGRHICALAREARALFEAAKRANDLDSAKRLVDSAYDAAVRAEGLNA